MSGLPLYPRHPERVCWGCDKYCPARELVCGSDTVRTPHPAEVFGDAWVSWAFANGVLVGGPDPSAKSN